MKLKNLLFLSIFISGLAGLVMGSSLALAMPRHPDLKTGVRVIEMYQRARERSPRLNAPGPLANPSGTYRILIIMVDFSNQRGQTNPDLFRNLLFITNSTGSMLDYLQEVSYGQFGITGEVNGTLSTPPDWFLMPQDYIYYVDSQSGLGTYPKNAQKLAEDAVIAADPFVDYRLYDNDGNGVVDSLFILHSGIGAETSKNYNDAIWSHRWTMKNPPVLDGMKFRGYCMVPEYVRNPGDSTIGVFCHEYGHELGLPDLYDVSGEGEGIGDWGLMSGGSWNGKPYGSRPAHPCAWSKIRLGWAIPVIIQANQTGLNIPQVENQASIFQLWTNGEKGPQYFLLENRQRTLFDDGLPGDGLLIYHIDDQVSRQDDPAHYKVDIEQADGAFDLNNGTNRGDDADPWPGASGKRTFDTESVPSSTDYNGRSTLVAVKNISDSAPAITVDLYIREEAVSLPLPE